MTTTNMCSNFGGLWDSPPFIKELIRNEMLVTMLQNLQKMASIGLTLAVSTASVERYFSHMKLIKTRLQNSFTEGL